MIDAFAAMSQTWGQALADYDNALSSAEKGTPDELRNRFEELSCARMISCQLRCSLEIFRFHRWRLGVIAGKGLQPPCKVPLDEEAVEILKRQTVNAKEALALTQQDIRLGFHQEAQAKFYDSGRIQQAIAVMCREIGTAV